MQGLACARAGRGLSATRSPKERRAPRARGNGERTFVRSRACRPSAFVPRSPPLTLGLRGSEPDDDPRPTTHDRPFAAQDGSVSGGALLRRRGGALRAPGTARLAQNRLERHVHHESRRLTARESVGGTEDTKRPKMERKREGDVFVGSCLDPRSPSAVPVCCILSDRCGRSACQVAHFCAAKWVRRSHNDQKLREGNTVF